ncbi:MAG TPA: M14 family zinc carboxypeptidase, partial [Herpetosiphonaceae bacterium]|nr:M14 family zinc carboxypeptidase [Herpetosiphonaceae bacterium]
MHTTPQRRRTILSCAWIAILCCGLALARAPRPTTAQAPADQRQVVRIAAATHEQAHALSARGLDLLEMRDGDDLFAIVSEAEISELQAAGYAVRPDAEQTRLAAARPRVMPVLGGYRTVEEGYALLDTWQETYPTLAKTFVYGASWERLDPGVGAGYDLKGITLTNQLIPGPKPIFFLMSAIHAREMTTAEISLRFVDYLLTNYATNADIRWMLDEHTIVVVPFANPDGRKIAETGQSQRKNRNTVDTPTCTGVNIGVDLNRNSHFKWGTVDKPTTSPCGATWPGKSVASEPEVSGLEAWVTRLFADLRGPNDSDPAPDTTPGVFISLHSYSNLVLWPYGWTYDPAPNDADLAGLGRKFASYNNYPAQQSTDLYPT